MMRNSEFPDTFSILSQHLYSLISKLGDSEEEIQLLSYTATFYDELQACFMQATVTDVDSNHYQEKVKALTIILFSVCDVLLPHLLNKRYYQLACVLMELLLSAEKVNPRRHLALSSFYQLICEYQGSAFELKLFDLLLQSPSILVITHSPEYSILLLILHKIAADNSLITWNNSIPSIRDLIPLEDLLPIMSTFALDKPLVHIELLVHALASFHQTEKTKSYTQYYNDFIWLISNNRRMREEDDNQVDCSFGQSQAKRHCKPR